MQKKDHFIDLVNPNKRATRLKNYYATILISLFFAACMFVRGLGTGPGDKQAEFKWTIKQCFDCAKQHNIQVNTFQLNIQQTKLQIRIDFMLPPDTFETLYANLVIDERLSVYHFSINNALIVLWHKNVLANTFQVSLKSILGLALIHGIVIYHK